MIDVADARDTLRAQFPCRFWLAENQYHTTSINWQSENNYQKPGCAITTRNIGKGAFMKGETLRGVDGRIFRPGTMELRRGQTIYDSHRHSGAIPGVTPDAYSSLKIGIEVAHGKGQQGQDREEEASSGGPLTPIRMSGFPPDFLDSRVRERNTKEESWIFMGCNGYAWTNMLDTQQADEMFNLFINIDECDDMI